MFSNVNAVNLNSAYISSGGDCGELLKYQGIVRKIYYAQYTHNGVSYPAYCLDKTKQGVNNDISYSVSVENSISDVKLWRIIINGYPYKTIEELGCYTKEEAFSATKQAIYCYIHGNNPYDYEGIGEAGQRTLNALRNILANAEQCSSTQISNIVKVVKEKDSFEVDDIDKEYVSKQYYISAGGNIKNYNVKLLEGQDELPEGIKITDTQNNVKKEFYPNEKFKILIPIKNLTKNSNFKISINTQINSKAVLYGKAPNSSYQDYALTAATYEDATGNTEDNYYKNETKVKIIKQDEETKEKLENVEFNILDSNKNIVYSNLKTNKDGEIKIENILPGKYYIQETNAKEGYLINKELIECEVELNQELTITINNSFEKKPIKIEKTTKNAEKTILKKLPVTGM